MRRETELTAKTHSSADDFKARSADELNMSKGDYVDLIERDDDFDDGWYLGRHRRTCETGLFPQGEAFFEACSRRKGGHGR